MATVVNKWYTAGTGARALLVAEQYGFAIDATSYDTVTAAAYTGGPVGGTLAIHADNVTDKPNIPMDAAAGLLKGASPLVNSGTSPKMVHFPTSPYVRWSPHNLCLQSQTFDNAAWTKTTSSISADTADTVAPDGTSTADKLTLSGAGSMKTTSDITTVANFVYTFSVYAKVGAGANWLELGVSDSGASIVGRAWFDLVNGLTGTTSTAAGTVNDKSNAIVSVGSGWYRCSFTFSFNAATLQGYIIPVDGDGNHADGDNGDTQYFWGAQVNRGYTATPYLVTTSAARIGIPQSYDTAAAVYGILCEPTATNLQLNSEAMGTGWSASDITVTSDSIASPDGATTADLLTEGTVGNAQLIGQSITVTASVNYTVSAYVKTGNLTWLRVQYSYTSGGSDVEAWFNIASGVAGTLQASGTATATSSSITAIGNGWYRITLTGIIGSNTSARMVFLSAAADASGTHVNNATYYIWGTQLELGTYATSYVPTLGSTVVRAADASNFTLTTIPYGATEGTVITWVKKRTINASVTQRYGVEFSDGTALNRISPITQTADNPDTYAHQMVISNGQWVDPTVVKGGTIDFTDGNKIALFYKANDSGILIDGGSEVVDTNTNGTVSPATIGTIGYAAGTAAREADGFIYQVTYIPRRMTQAQMQAKTT